MGNGAVDGQKPKTKNIHVFIDWSNAFLPDFFWKEKYCSRGNDYHSCIYESK